MGLAKQEWQTDRGSMDRVGGSLVRVLSDNESGMGSEEMSPGRSQLTGMMGRAPRTTGQEALLARLRKGRAGHGSALLQSQRLKDL
jgi:hypothetical protein